MLRLELGWHRTIKVDSELVHDLQDLGSGPRVMAKVLMTESFKALLGLQEVLPVLMKEL